jgi:hypothetical protein
MEKLGSGINILGPQHWVEETIFFIYNPILDPDCPQKTLEADSMNMDLKHFPQSTKFMWSSSV